MQIANYVPQRPPRFARRDGIALQLLRAESAVYESQLLVNSLASR